MGILDKAEELLGDIRDFNPVESLFGNWTPVDSSNITAFRYDASTHVLQVKFHGGRVYGYESVPQFTREYGRMFGRTPAKDARAVSGGVAQSAQALQR